MSNTTTPLVGPITDCALQSALIIVPVIGSVSIGTRVTLDKSYSLQGLAYEIAPGLASNAVGHFTKCIVAKSAKYMSETAGFGENLDLAIETTAGTLKYAIVDGIDPNKEISHQRIMSGTWNGFGYYYSDSVDNFFNSSLAISPVLIEALDGAIESKGEPLGAIIGALAGFGVSLSIKYLYQPTLESLETTLEELQLVGKEIQHDEL